VAAARAEEAVEVWPRRPVIAPGVTSLGGTWEVHLRNDTVGAEMIGFATSLGSATPSVWETILTSTVPVGASTLSLVATRRAVGSSLLADPVPSPVEETCTAAITVIGR
jgi:hypothetical protein